MPNTLDKGAAAVLPAFEPPAHELLSPDGQTIYYTFEFTADTIKSLRRFLDTRREPKRNEVTGQAYEEALFPEPGGTYKFLEGCLDTVIQPWVERYPEGEVAQKIAATRQLAADIKASFRPVREFVQTQG